MLTKSDNVDDILSLPHNGHTIIAWSMNNERVSRKYEIGAPPFERRLGAAVKVQEVGYPVRIRLDPIVPFEGWQEAYSETIKQIFSKIRNCHAIYQIISFCANPFSSIPPTGMSCEKPIFYN